MPASGGQGRCRTSAGSVPELLCERRHRVLHLSLSGSPGPLARNTPSGSWPRISAAARVMAGTTSHFDTRGQPGGAGCCAWHRSRRQPPAARCCRAPQTLAPEPMVFQPRYKSDCRILPSPDPCLPGPARLAQRLVRFRWERHRHARARPRLSARHYHECGGSDGGYQHRRCRPDYVLLARHSDALRRGNSTAL